MNGAFERLADDLKVAFEVGVLEPWSDERFDEFANRVVGHQLEANPTYAGYCRRRGYTVSGSGGWKAAPPVPTSAFKAIPLVAGDPTRVQRVFLTSGTTRGTRGEHHVLDLGLYRASLLPNLDARLYAAAAGSGADGSPDRADLRLLGLTPSPAQAPESSLSFMLGEALDVLSGGDGDFFVHPEGGLDVAGLSRALERAVRDGTAVLLAGTAFAFVHWLDFLAEAGRRFELPEGSRMLETGGFKGRSRTVSRAELYAALSEGHGVPRDRIVNEYGMTELMSQFYEPVLSTPPGSLEARVHVAPPWMRSRALDPYTLEPLPAGETGLLCHYDLANAGSVMAVLTEDVGSVEADGSLRLAGRVEGAEPRGCSLAMDDLMTGIF